MIVVAGLVAAVRRCWESGALKEFFRTLLRTVQTWFPGLVDAKYVTQRSIRRVLRRPFEQEFRAVQLLGLPVGALILDVGANRGQSIDALRFGRSRPQSDRLRAQSAVGGPPKAALRPET